ncbi:hypothetical protein NM688_g2599 [Phlebia brevispora]|uniref:Uncharacterized protein n=1 Tax=Phlebia brevispora TaxID=194682 RepID=A0ACC1T8U1_9APHY|nr:hypothetical protein NM688_g2599 [Phlebia brevispora]
MDDSIGSTPSGSSGQELESAFPRHNAWCAGVCMIPTVFRFTVSTIMSAADLQRRHAELEGAPDPFPSLADTPSKPHVAPAANGSLDTSSVEAFPSLASTAGKPAAPATAWAAAPRIKATTSKHTVFSDSFTTPVVDLSTAGRDGKPTTLGEIMKQIMSQYKVKLDASTNQKLRQTTFFLKSEHKKELEKAKKSLLAMLSPVVTLVVQAPASTIPIIIGPKGATLKQVRDQTGVKIDIPRKDSLNGHTNGGSHEVSRTATPQPTGDEDEEPTVPVTITGAEPLALEAQALLQGIIATKTSRGTQRFIEAAEGADVSLTLNRHEDGSEIVVSGDREAVGRVVESVRSAIDYFTSNVTSLKMTLPKRQHRLLMGQGAEEIMSSSQCAVIVQKIEEPGDEITVWGRAQDLANGLTAVMEKANSAYIHEFPLPGPIAISRQLLTYMTRIGYPKTLSDANPGVQVYTPPQAVIDRSQVLNVDILGEKPAVDSAVRQLSQLVGKLIGATKDVPIDWLVHRIINSHKNAKKIKSFHENENVLVFFPPEEAEQSSVLLVYDPLSPNASPSPAEKAQKLEETETVEVEKKWHDAVVGRGGTTLNAIIGEDKTLSIKVGAEAGNPSNEDIIVVRGIRADVDRAVKEIKQIVADAQNDEIVSSYSVEFEIGQEFVGRIVGSQGSNINKLRDSLGVKIDFIDEYDDKDKDASVKKKKAVHQKAKVKITGRKENVEEAKKRIIMHADRLADETSEILKIPHQYHPSLIGQSGKYVIRLEDKYDVKITFPRGASSSENGEGKNREHNLKPDEVFVKGGRKGVAGAKSELLEALEFEKESNNVVKFTVPTRSVARILGRGGASINEIKDTTGAQIDVDKSTDDSNVTNISCRGTKQAIEEAKAAILAIAEQVHDEVTETILIENKFHRTLIGQGGRGLKELVARCGGPADPKTQAGLIRL